MSDEIDIRISPALHPANVRQIDGYDDVAVRQVLAPTETAFSAAYVAVQSVWDARAVVAKNTALTEDGRLLQLDTFAKKKLNGIAGTFDTTRANLERGISFLEGELSQPLREAAVTSMGREIRGHVKAMTTSERQEFVQDAIDAGDEETVAAVLGAKHYLTGMTAEMQAVLTRFWNEKQQPDKARRLKAMVAAKEMIEQRAGLVFPAMEAAVGGTSMKAKQVREAQAAAEKALNS